MAEAQVDRGVLFTLKVAADDDAASRLTAFGKDIAEAYKNADRAGLDSWRQACAIRGNVLDEQLQQEEVQLRRSLEKREQLEREFARKQYGRPRAQPSPRQPDRPADASPARPDAAAADVDAVRETEKTKTAIVTSEAKKRAAAEEESATKARRSERQKAADAEAGARQRAAAEEQSATRASRAHKESATSAGRAAQRSADAVDKATNEKIRDEERLTKEHADELDKRARAEADARRKAEKQTRAELNKAKQQYSRAQSDLNTATRSMNDGLAQAGEGLVKVGRGFAALGIAGEEDIEKLLRALVRLQGIVDLGRGTIEMYRGIRQGVDMYRKSVLAATAAEEALAAARMKSAASGGVSSTTGSMGGSAIGGATGGALGSLTTAANGASAALLSMPGAISAAVLGVGAALSMALNIGGSRDRAAAYMGEKIDYSPNTFAGRATNLGARTFNRALTAGIPGMNFVRDSWQMDIPFLDLGDERASAAGSQESLAKRQAERESALSQIGRNRQRRALTNERDKAVEAIRLEARLRNAGQGLEGNEKEVAIARERQEAIREQQTALRAKATGTRRDLMAATKRENIVGVADASSELQKIEHELAEAAGRSAAAAENRLNIEKRIADERIRAADESIAKTQQELNLRQNQIEAERQRLMTAEERFGQLGGEEQERLINLMRRAQNREELSVEDWQAVRGVGTRRATEMANRAFRERTAGTEFGQFYGLEERERMRNLREQKQELEVRLKGEQEIKVQIEQDSETLAKRLTAEITTQYDRFMARTIELTKAYTDQQIEELNRQAAHQQASMPINQGG